MDAATLESWIANWVAQKLGVPPGDVDVDVPLADLGMDSMAALELSGRLESLLGREVSPTVAMEHATIAAVAAHLLHPA